MKCPKCGYIGFETGDRCHNCGYDFSLAATLGPDLEVPLKSAEPLGPLADLALEPETRRQPPGRRKLPDDLDLDRLIGEAERAPDLPLFRDDRGRAGAAPAPPAAAQPPRAPLAVRRPVPPAPRHRPRAIPPKPEPMALELEVEAPSNTPESIPLPVSAEPRTAGAGRRLAGGVIDLALLAGIDAIVLYFTLRLCQIGFGEIVLLPIVPMVAFYALLNGGYFVAFTAAGGRTIGKMAAGTKTVDLDGGDVAFGQAVVRALAYLASALPFGLGLVPAVVGQARRALHDRLANTRVVRAPSS